MLQMLMSDKADEINVTVLRVKTNSLMLKQLEQTQSLIIDISLDCI